MKLAATALLSATAMVFLTPMASAQSYERCEQERQNRQVTGAIIGGLLGAVVGNELADDDDDRHYHRRHHRYDRYDRYDRRHDRHHRRHHRRHRHHDDDNDEAVATLAGAGVGALIGAGIAGGEDCNTYRNDRRYDDRQYQRSGHNDRYGYNQPYRTNNNSYSDSYDSYSSGELLGGRPSAQSRTYEARSYQEPAYGAQTYQASQSWRCEYRTSPQYNERNELRYVEVRMCQGADGIWRPSDGY